jgi:hypothetical protein
MYLQEILEVAIGLVFVWLVLSLATMSLQEWMGNLVNLRAKDLEHAIVQMLSSQDLTRRFYKYPLIANLYKLPKKPGQKGRLPSYIPANKFSATLFELVIQAGMANSPVQSMTGEIEGQIASMESPEQQNLARDDWEAILETAGNVSAAGLGTAALDSLKFQVQAFGEKYPELGLSIDTLITRLDANYRKFVEEQRLVQESGANSGLAMRQFHLGMVALEETNPPLKESINAVVRQADVSVMSGEQAASVTRVNLESWFNDAMDRLSGTYKRRAQFIAFLIGFILALILNVDSINVAASLWREPTLRQVIITEAENYTQNANCAGVSGAGPLENIPALETQLQALNIPFGWTIVPFNSTGSQCPLLPIGRGRALGIPSLNNQGQVVCNGITNLPMDLNGWLRKILGMLMTGLAAAQGAPFWFDILKKIINVRGTGSNPLEQKPVG